MAYGSHYTDKVNVAVNRYENDAGEGDNGQESFSNTIRISHYRYGSSVPGYRQKLRSGEDATSVFNAGYDKLTYTPLTVSASRRTTVGTWHHTREAYGNPLVLINMDQSFPRSDGVPDATLALIDQMATERWETRALKALRNVEGFPLLIELKKTIRQIKSPLRGIRDLLLDHYRRIDALSGRGKTRHSFKRIAEDSWLEAQLGIIPAMSDVQNLSEAAASIFERLDTQSVPIAVRIKRKIPRSVIGSESGLPVNGKGPVCGFSGDYTLQGECGVYIKGKVTPSGGLVRPLDRLGLNAIRDFVPALWEVTPYSFLVDYFTNVQELCQHMCFPWSNVNFVSHTKWMKLEKEITLRFKSEEFYTSYAGLDPFAVSSAPRVKWTRKSVSRDRILAPPAFRLDLGLSPRQWITTGSLALARADTRRTWQTLG